MKREFVFFVFLLLVIGVSIMLVIAESGSGSEGSSGDSSESLDLGGSDSSGISSGDSSGSSDDSKLEDEDKTKIETRSIIIDEQGREVEVRTKIEDGKIEERRTFTDENGNEITIKTKTEAGEGISIKKISYYIKVKGVEVKTKLSIREVNKDGETILRAKLSTGIEQDIIVLPDEALQIALEELKATNDFTFEIDEFVEEDKRKAVFSAKAKKPGRLLGIFATEVDLEALIDTETGEVIKTNKPWWAFLVVGSKKFDMCHVSDENVVNTINIAILAVEAHLAHGDSAGACEAVCGDGIITRGEGDVEIETCDDGNTVDGDGCSSSCLNEIIEVLPK